MVRMGQLWKNLGKFLVGTACAKARRRETEPQNEVGVKTRGQVAQGITGQRKALIISLGLWKAKKPLRKRGPSLRKPKRNCRDPAPTFLFLLNLV